VATDDCLAAVGDGAIDLCEGHHAPCIAHGENREEGVGCQAGNDVGCCGAGGEIGQVKGIDCTLSLFGRRVMRVQPLV